MLVQAGQGRSEIEIDGVAVGAAACVVTHRRGFQSSKNAGVGRKMSFLDGHYLSCARVLECRRKKNERPFLKLAKVFYLIAAH